MRSSASICLSLILLSALPAFAADKDCGHLLNAADAFTRKFQKLQELQASAVDGEIEPTADYDDLDDVDDEIEFYCSLLEVESPFAPRCSQIEADIMSSKDAKKIEAFNAMKADWSKMETACKG